MVRRLSVTDQNGVGLNNVPTPVNGGDAINKTYADGLVKGIAPTIFVAASTATDKIKAGADYICDGVADQVQINAALADIATSGGTVELSIGTFNVSAQIAWASDDVHLVGQGQDATKIVNSTASANFDLVKIGNRQVDGIMRNSCTIERLTLTHAGGASTKATLWVDGGGRGSGVFDVRTNEGSVGVRFTDLDRYAIRNLDANNPRAVAVLYEVGAEGTFGKVAMRDSSMNLSDANSVGLRLDTLTSTNPFDSLIFENNLFFSTANVAGTIGAQFNLAAVDTVFIGGQFESPQLAHVDINTSNDSRIVFQSVSFIQNGSTATTNAFRFNGANHGIVVNSCVIQNTVNAFNGVSGWSNLVLLGSNKDNGNVTNLFTGQFGSKTGTDVAFAGNGNLVLGLDNQRYEWGFFNKLRVAEGAAVGKILAATNADGTLGYIDPPSGGGGSGITRSIVSVTSATTLSATALVDVVALIGASGAPTLPTAVGNTNRYTVKNVHTTDKTITFTSGQTADGSTSITLHPNESLDFISNNSNWLIV